MTVYISDRHGQLARAFNELKAELQTQTRFKFDRYRVWAENVGAAKSESNYGLSLDYRLREAPFYKDQASNNTTAILNCFRLATAVEMLLFSLSISHQ